jgi:hypothetical protein
VTDSADEFEGRHVVRNPQLRALVELARAQQPPELGITVEDVWRRADAKRARTRGWHGWTVAGMVAMAAGLVAWLVVSSPADVEETRPDASPAQASKVRDSGAADSGLAAQRSPQDAVLEGSPTDDATPEPEPEPVLALAEGVVFEPLGDAAPATILASWRVEVAGGSYRVETPVDGDVLEIVVGPRVTRIEPGSTLTFDASLHADTTPEPLTAGELARQAEQAMATGRRAEAIRALTKLARKHPYSPQARAGLVDLARLHKADGAWDRARCAYQLYLDRFPGASLRPEVERALYKLGEGKACSGLTPR